MAKGGGLRGAMYKNVSKIGVLVFDIHENVCTLDWTIGP